MSQNYHEIFIWCMQQEDRGLTGRVVNLNDGGGRTRFGIAEHFNPNLPVDFYTTTPTLALAQAGVIYKKQYWDRFCGDQILSDDVASCLLSYSINDGTNREIKMLQACLGLPADGVMGPQTLYGTNAYNSTMLAAALRAAQADWYRAIVAKQPTDTRFLKGWLARAGRVYPSLD
jgi:lysozyme family protein